VDEAGGETLPAKAGLDRFCLNCHDGNGANQIATFKFSSGDSRTANDPFWDGATNIMNTYDGVNRSAVVDTSRCVPQRLHGRPGRLHSNGTTPVNR
jgi:hypothetical protein